MITWTCRKCGRSMKLHTGGTSKDYWMVGMKKFADSQEDYQSLTRANSPEVCIHDHVVTEEIEDKESEDMPQSSFNVVENEECRINPTLMIIAKAVIQGGKSGQQIMDENNIVGVITETLDPDMATLGGKSVPVFRFRGQYQLLTNEELAKKEIEDKKKAEEQAKKDAEQKIADEKAAIAAAASAPPPAVDDTTKQHIEPENPNTTGPAPALTRKDIAANNPKK